MSQDFFINLPSDIIVNILSNLPVRTITHCKCVCKSWLHLLQTNHFIHHHLSKSTPGMAVLQQTKSSDVYEIYEFEDDPNLEHHDLHYNLITKFKLPYPGLPEASVNGLLFLRNSAPQALFMCNPITHELISIHSPKEFEYMSPQVATFGFGCSRTTNQYKVVRIFHDCKHDLETNKWLVSNSNCKVYTLGTGSWKTVAPGDPFMYCCRSVGAFVDGNLHWLVFDANGSPWISCFDLETEVFSIVAPPPLPLSEQRACLADVFAFEGCMCVCDNSSEDEIVVWLMKECWTKEFVVEKPDVAVSSYDPFEVVRPIKLFGNGDLLMAWGDFFLFYSSSEGGRRNIIEIEMFGARSFGAIQSILHTSTFLSLKSFGMEMVSSFSSSPFLVLSF